MRKSISLLVFCLLVSILKAQIPQGINYQAIVRNADGTIKNNEQITLEIAIIQDSILGSEVYSEQHIETSNDFGLITVVIGKGTTLDDFSAINWANYLYFIKTEADGVVMGTQQLMSVPYAMSALTASKASTIDGYSPSEISTLLENLKHAAGLILTDYDGNNYKTYRLNNTLWMAEDLRTTHYADGREIEYYDTIVFSWDTAYNYNTRFYISIPDTFKGDGLFYSSTTVVDSTLFEISKQDIKCQGICPKGWRLPNRNDVDELTDTFSHFDVLDIIAPEWLSAAELETVNSTGLNFHLNGYYRYDISLLKYVFFNDYLRGYYPNAYDVISSGVDIEGNILFYTFQKGEWGVSSGNNNRSFNPVRCVKDL